jgi:hypothetical protein
MVSTIDRIANNGSLPSKQPVICKPDPVVEQFLDRHGIRWTFREIEISQIDQAKGLRNQARAVPLMKRLVDQYVANMLDGDHFPAIVLYEEADGSRWPLGGNHRLASGVEVGERTVWAYLVPPVDPVVMESLIYGLNPLGPVAPEIEERIDQGVRLVRVHKKTAKAASLIVHVPAQAILSKVELLELEERLATQHASPGKLVPSVLRAFAPLKNNRVLAEAVIEAQQARLDTSLANQLYKAIPQMESESIQLQAIRTFMDDPEMRSRKGVTRNGRDPFPPSTRARESLFSKLKGVTALMVKYKSAPDMGLSQERSEELLRQVEQLRARCEEFVHGPR